MKKHHDTRDFFLGAIIGGVLGVAAVSMARGKKGIDMHKIRMTIEQFSKSFHSSQGNNFAELIDWTANGVQLWKKLKKRG